MSSKFRSDVVRAITNDPVYITIQIIYIAVIFIMQKCSISCEWCCKAFVCKLNICVGTICSMVWPATNNLRGLFTLRCFLHNLLRPRLFTTNLLLMLLRWCSLPANCLLLLTLFHLLLLLRDNESNVLTILVTFFFNWNLYKINCW